MRLTRRVERACRTQSQSPTHVRAAIAPASAQTMLRFREGWDTTAIVESFGGILDPCTAILEVPRLGSPGPATGAAGWGEAFGVVARVEAGEDGGDTLGGFSSGAARLGFAAIVCADGGDVGLGPVVSA